MTQPIIWRLKARDLISDYAEARIVLVPGDRKEAVRFAMDAYEAGKIVWHLGAGDECEGDSSHYDGLYRKVISQIARASGGKTLGLRPEAKADVIVGPTMIDDIPKKLPCPKESYTLLCMNPTPFADDDIPNPNHSIGFGYAMRPGDEGMEDKIRWKWSLLEPMSRIEFLGHIKGAKRVIGNSSLLTYEAPLWHLDEEIEFIGMRNKGRGTVRWNGPSPSDAVVSLLEDAL